MNSKIDILDRERLAASQIHTSAETVFLKKPDLQAKSQFENSAPADQRSISKAIDTIKGPVRTAFLLGFSTIAGFTGSNANGQESFRAEFKASSGSNGESSFRIIDLDQSSSEIKPSSETLNPRSRATLDPTSNPFLSELTGESPILSGLVTSGTLDRLHGPILRNDLKINGSQSCAISNCHNGPRPATAAPWAMRGSEYQLWLENDPHSRSWRTMCSDESVAMMTRLGILQDNEIIDQQAFDNCLSCHNSTGRYADPRSIHRQATQPHDADQNAIACRTRQSTGDASDVGTFMKEGVGCSGCHGPSDQWINTHFQDGWTASFATSNGFVNNGDLVTRGRMCASCHVGDKDRDMNHDIIAAGHPALRYELATFHAWQPKHWRDDEAADGKYYEAQLWLAGQIAATDASLSLIQARSSRRLSESQWPEFAAYDCASCHHNLGLDNARDPITDSRSATAMHSSWNDAGIRWLIQFRGETGSQTALDIELLKSLDRVRNIMQQEPRPDAIATANAALEARRSLAAWHDSTAGNSERAILNSDRLGRLVASAAGKRATFATWESTVQFYLAAVAARASWPGGWNGPVKTVADQLRFGLRYPEMIDVSRFAKQDSGGPTLDRADAMRLGIELAGWLGPVSPETLFDKTTDDDTITRELQSELEAMVREINARWKRLNEQENQERAGRGERKQRGAAGDDNKDNDAASKAPSQQQDPDNEDADAPTLEQLRKQLRDRLDSVNP